MICLDAFKNINITTHQGDLYISPCCITELEKVDHIDFAQDAYLKRVRGEFLAGRWPAECHKCKLSESNNQISRRIGSNKWYDANNINDTNEDLIRIDYWVGDICNSACVICGPENSSLWKQELNIPIHHRKVNRNVFWKKLDLEKLQYIHFHGGEPLLSKDHEEFLRAVPNKSNVHIYYNTNATVRAEAKLLDLWSQFRLVQIDFSVDDIGDRFEYLRYPAKWSVIKDNLFWYRDNSPANCIFDIMTTISILNEPYIQHLSDWVAENFNTNRFTDPIEHRFQYAVGRMAIDNHKKLNVLDFLTKLDQRRGTDWKSIFPLAITKLKTD